MNIVMNVRMLAAAASVAAATPARAAGTDSRRSSCPASAYSGYIAQVGAQVAEDEQFTSPAYRYSGPHAGGLANALPRR